MKQLALGHDDVELVGASQEREVLSEERPWTYCWYGTLAWLSRYGAQLCVGAVEEAEADEEVGVDFKAGTGADSDLVWTKEKGP